MSAMTMGEILEALKKERKGVAVNQGGLQINGWFPIGGGKKARISPMANLSTVSEQTYSLKIEAFDHKGKEDGDVEHHGCRVKVDPSKNSERQTPPANPPKPAAPTEAKPAAKAPAAKPAKPAE